MPRAEWALVLVALACVAAVVVLPGRAEAGRGQGRGRFGVLAPGDDGAATPPGADAAQSPSPSWKCRVCEDVVQTWHDRFKCAGSSLAMSPPNPFSPEAESKPFQSCRQPKLDCNDLNAKLQPVCKAMRYQFITRTEKVIWSSIMNRGNVYDTCIELGKCVNDTEQTDAKECRDAFKQPSCKEHLTCAPVQQKCSSRCFLCYHLVRDWPLFQQTCKPEGAKVEAEAFLDEEKVQLSNGPKPDAEKSGKLPGGGGKSSFLQTFMRNHQRKDFFARNTQRHRARDKAAEDRAWNDRVAGPFAAPPQRASRSDYFDEDLLTFLETELRAVPPRGGGGGDGGSAYDALDDQQQEEEQRLVEQYRHALLSVAEQQRAAVEQRQQNAAALWAGERADAGMGAGMDAAAAEAADDQAPKIPITNSDTLPLKCHDMWDSVRYSKKARYFVQWKEEVSILTTGRDRMDPAGLWDANIVCKCLGHCELSKFEYMGLEKVCKYGPPEQRTMDMALGEYIRDKPHSAVSPKDGDDNLADGAADE